jgi:hypothetical protein
MFGSHRMRGATVRPIQSDRTRKSVALVKRKTGNRTDSNVGGVGSGELTASVTRQARTVPAVASSHRRFATDWQPRLNDLVEPNRALESVERRRRPPREGFVLARLFDQCYDLVGQGRWIAGGEVA